MNRLNSGYISLSQCVYLSTNRFSMAWENGIQIPFPFFVFAWHWKTDLNFAFCFSFSTNFEKRFWTSYFVSASLWKTDMNFSFRFSFSHHFEKRIWISFFVFTSLWKTDLNFVFVWLVIWKTDLNFVCRYCTTLEKRITTPVIWSPWTPPRGWPGNSLFTQRKASEFSSPQGQSEWWTPPHPHDMSHTRGTPFF